MQSQNIQHNSSLQIEESNLYPLFEDPQSIPIVSINSFHQNNLGSQQRGSPQQQHQEFISYEPSQSQTSFNSIQKAELVNIHFQKVSSFSIIQSKSSGSKNQHSKQEMGLLVEEINRPIQQGTEFKCKVLYYKRHRLNHIKRIVWNFQPSQQTTTLEKQDFYRQLSESFQNKQVLQGIKNQCCEQCTVLIGQLEEALQPAIGQIRSVIIPETSFAFKIFKIRIECIKSIIGVFQKEVSENGCRRYLGIN